MTRNVRFAPSPTGMLHIGGARTALINKLFTLAQGGNYYLRIEDTDQERSTDEARQAIMDGLEWLGLLPDTDIILQSKNIRNHVEAAESLVAKGLAYYCYESPEQLAEKRMMAEKNGQKYIYDRFWRDKTEAEAKKLAPNVAPSVRLKVPLDGANSIDDLVQGTVIVGNEQLDDFIILRSDKTPTYLLSCVVDDMDMQISHIIRGDDHLTNAFRQKQLFDALGAELPIFAHIPLLYGEDGKKFSKRHGAIAIAEYQKMGYLPDAIINYLLRLGWGKGDDEKITLDEAAKIFQLQDLSKAPARFDFMKLNFLNTLYIKEEENLLPLLDGFLMPEYRANKQGMEAFTKGLNGLAERAERLTAFATLGAFYFTPPNLEELEDLKALKALKSETAEQVLKLLHHYFKKMNDDDEWHAETIHATLVKTVNKLKIGFGKVAQPLRAALSGTMASPDLSEIVDCLGRDETMKRIETALKFIRTHS